MLIVGANMSRRISSNTHLTLRIRRHLHILALGCILAALPHGTQAATENSDSQIAEVERSGGLSSARGRHDLPALIAYALTHNPEVSATAFDTQAASARTTQAHGADLPRISIEGGYALNQPDLRLIAARFNGELGVFGNNILATDLVLRLPLYAGGRLVAEMRAAELLEASAGQRLARSKGDLVYNVSSLYFGQLAQMRLIESLDVSAAALASHLEQVNALIAARKAARVDALRSEVKLADLRQRSLRERNTLAVQQRALLNLMGAGEASADFALAGTLSRPASEYRTTATLGESALEHRPDMIGARAEFDAQKARVEAARAGNRPTINLVAAVGNRSMVQPTQQPSGQPASDTVSRIGITLEIPLYDGGRTTGRVDEETAKLEAQRQRLDKLRMQIRLEVDTAHANLASALERLASTDKVISLATESLRIEQEKYALGRGTELDVLDAQSALLDAETTRIRTLADANASAAQLTWATGENLR